MDYSKVKNITILVLLSTLIGCGGGGGGGAATPPASTVIVENNETVVNTVEVVQVADTELPMSELIASADFTFTNKQQINVALDLSELLAVNNQTGQRAYVSIYGDYQLLPSGEIFPQASSRVLAGDLINGQFNHAFIAMNNQNEYLIEVWFYNGQPAIQKQEKVIDNRLSW